MRLAERLRSDGGEKSVETRPNTGWLSRLKTQSPTVLENPAWVPSAFTSTTVIRANEDALSSTTLPSPPRGSRLSTIVGEPASSSPVRPTSAIAPWSPFGTPPNSLMRPVVVGCTFISAKLVWSSVPASPGPFTRNAVRTRCMSGIMACTCWPQ